MAERGEVRMVEEMVKDVVCGMVKPKSQMSFKAEFAGKAYYFCAEEDKLMFEAHPDRWVKKEESNG